MAGSIKLFQMFQKCQKLIGIYPFQPNETRRSFIMRKAVILPSVPYLVCDGSSMNAITIYFLLIWQSGKNHNVL